MKKYLFLVLVLNLFLVACKNKTADEQKSGKKTAVDAALLDKAKNIFKALPATADNPDNPVTEAKISLGKMLYYDTRLSLTGNNSCNSCHNLATYGVDNLPTSKGDNGGFGDRNSPTVYNAALHSMQFWDGRAKDVEEQAGGPILNPAEMAMASETEVEKRLAADPVYQQLFSAAFPEDKAPVSYKNIQKAIGAFERTLLTPSPFDYLLNGNTLAFTAKEQAGLKEFIDLGCISCHSGASIGGSMFQKFGVYSDYHILTKSKAGDEGRKKVTKQDADKDMFKVPGLRNVAKTAPYFHDGSVENLNDAVKIMAKVQLNKDLTDEQVSDIVAFLHTLTGEIPQSALQNNKQTVNK